MIYLIRWDEVKPDGSKVRRNKATQPSIAVRAESQNDALDRARKIVGHDLPGEIVAASFEFPPMLRHGGVFVEGDCRGIQSEAQAA